MESRLRCDSLNRGPQITSELCRIAYVKITGDIAFAIDGFLRDSTYRLSPSQQRLLERSLPAS